MHTPRFPAFPRSWMAMRCCVSSHGKSARASSSRSPKSCARNSRPFPARDGTMGQLSNLVEVRATAAPQSLNHFNRLRAVKITGTLLPGYTIDDALKAMDDAAKRVLPPTAQTDLDGQSREFRASGKE